MAHGSAALSLRVKQTQTRKCFAVPRSCGSPYAIIFFFAQAQKTLMAHGSALHAKKRK
jgi:hypothetical protein